MSYPKQFGLPCWEKDQAERCINIVAQVSKEKAPLFLSTHSPIKNIMDIKTGSIVTEEEAYKSIFSRKGEIRGVVRGGPGTGKSHLIRWINLRAEYAAKNKERGLDKFKIVMVQRETGSLKSALKQIVDQLGDEFEQYIEDIKNSIDKFSENTVREELITELALEINSRWEQRGNIPLSDDLKNLGDVLLSPGCRKWFGRDDGVIAQKISRLTDRSTQEDRKKKILFDIQELKPSPNYLNRNQDSINVYNFFEHIEYEEDIAEEAVRILNQALEEAQRELTGIKGAKLNEIFTSIRRKLKQQKKELVVFIEDVTAASGGLDYDLFQAFEPKEGHDLCRMIALLGMTNEGWNVLPDNEKDRVKYDFDIGNNASEWASDSKMVAQFTARYLNAIRCDDTEINLLAKDRFSSDISMSKCDECPYKEECHKTFGSIEFEDNVKIGLFPFTIETPNNLLKALNESHYRSSPRGLLDAVMDGALIKSYGNFNQRKFPSSLHFSVQRNAINYWTEFEAKYLGGSAWSDRAKKEQVRFLAEFWVSTSSSDETASKLTQYRKSFSIPDFSAKPQDPIVTAPPKGGNEIVPPQPTSPQQRNKALDEQLTLLETWSREDRLNKDSIFRKYLQQFIDNSIKWQDHQGVPIKFAIKTANGSTKPIRIIGQVSKPSGQNYFLDFLNDKETYDLLEALTRYNAEGKNSWEFDGGELHKRRTYRWLRKNEQRIIKSIDPEPSSMIKEAITSASQLLALIAILRGRDPLPIMDRGKRISELFHPIWDTSSRPQMLSNTLNGYIEDLELKFKNLQEFIIAEVGVGQGTAAPSSFINPLPILESLKNFEKDLIVNVPPEELGNSFWSTRFEVVTKIKSYTNLPKSIDEERGMIKNCLTEVKQFLKDFGFNSSNLKNDILECMDQLVEMIELQRAMLPYPNDTFDNLWRSSRLKEKPNEWSISLSQAEKITNSEKNIDTICFDSSSLRIAWNDLVKVVKIYLEIFENYLSDLENPGSDEQIGTKDEFLQELNEIIKIMNTDGE